jgi:osmotically inducible protein OsmC
MAETYRSRADRGEPSPRHGYGRCPQPIVEQETQPMATTRNATTHWEGSLMEGAGQVTLQSSGQGTFDVTWASRANEADGRTSPEELIAAAHSSCFSMALSHALAGAGTPAEALDTSADVTFQPGEGITGIHLTVRGSVPGMSAEDFVAAAETAKTNCPVSKALTGTTVTLDAALA